MTSPMIPATTSLLTSSQDIYNGMLDISVLNCLESFRKNALCERGFPEKTLQKGINDIVKIIFKAINEAVRAYLPQPLTPILFLTTQVRLSTDFLYRLEINRAIEIKVHLEDNVIADVFKSIFGIVVVPARDRDIFMPRNIEENNNCSDSVFIVSWCMHNKYVQSLLLQK